MAAVVNRGDERCCDHRPDAWQLREADRIICARTALINHMRGLLGEYGVILPQGAWRFLTKRTTPSPRPRFPIYT